MKRENTSVKTVTENTSVSANESSRPAHLVEVHPPLDGSGLHPGRSSLAQLAADRRFQGCSFNVRPGTSGVHPPSGSSHSSLLEVSYQAIGTQVNVWLAPDYATDSDALGWVKKLLTAFENRLSRFLPDSELVRLNQRAGAGPQTVSPLLFAVTESALSLARRSQGLVDPTVLPCLVREGYGPGPDVGQPDYRGVLLDHRRRTIALRQGLALDLGGVAKGWLADHLSNHLSSLGSVLVDVGGDLRARGLDSWKVEVEDPFDPANRILEIDLRNAGIATSNILKRSWSGSKHHLIDPRTGLSARTDLVASTVIAPTALQAEGEAKTVLLLGRAQAMEYLSRSRLAGLAVDRDANTWKVGIL